MRIQLVNQITSKHQLEVHLQANEKSKMVFCTPKDEITWLKLKHRNLKVAKTNGEDTRCLVCPHTESMIHLVECERIKANFWMKWKQICENLLLPMPQTDFNLTLLLGKSDDKPLHSETASFLAIVWRCIYREITQCRIYRGKQIDTRQTAI